MLEVYCCLAILQLLIVMQFINAVRFGEKHKSNIKKDLINKMLGIDLDKDIKENITNEFFGEFQHVSYLVIDIGQSSSFDLHDILIEVKHDNRIKKKKRTNILLEYSYNPIVKNFTMAHVLYDANDELVVKTINNIK